MRLLWLVLVMAVLPARADLYRWVDPDSGSVKFSSLPPSDPRVDAEVITPRSAALPKPAPPSPLQQVAPLETRWREMLAQLGALTPQALSRMGDDVRQQLEGYQALSAELDRVDPQGAARREQDALAVLQRLQKGSAR